TRGGALPPGVLLLDGFCPRLGLFASWKIVDFTAIQPIADANLDLVETIEDVELGERKAVNSAGQHSLPHKHGVEPAAAAGGPGHAADLTAPRTERFADAIVHLVGGKRTEPDARRVGLADTKHIVDGIRPKPGAGRRLCRHGVR